MKLTDELKKMVEKITSVEEAQKTLKDAGMELSDDELDEISGGSGEGDNDLLQYEPFLRVLFFRTVEIVRSQSFASPRPSSDEKEKCFQQWLGTKPLPDATAFIKKYFNLQSPR